MLITKMYQLGHDLNKGIFGRIILILYLQFRQPISQLPIQLLNLS
jgi:hypothetical protein